MNSVATIALNAFARAVKYLCEPRKPQYVLTLGGKGKIKFNGMFVIYCNFMLIIHSAQHRAMFNKGVCMSRVYDQWLDEPKHESDAFQHEFEMRIERHLQTDWNPQNYEMFIDALFDADLEPYKAQLTEAVKKGHLGALEIGTIICDMVHDYCEDKAKQLAKEEMGQS
jgi:hypothetical protein